MKTNWVVTTNFHPVWAGPSERFFRYARISENQGLKLVFKTLDRGLNTPYELLEGVEVFRYATSSYEVLLDLVATEAESNTQTVHKVIILGLSSKIARFNQRLRKMGIRVIYVSTMDFDLDKRDNGQKRGWLRRLLFVQYFKRTINSFDFIVSSSSFLSQQYSKKLSISQDKLTVIPNGVNLETFHAKPDAKSRLRQELNIPTDEFIFLFVGLMVERKGIIELLEAWEKYKKKGGEGVLLCIGAEKRKLGDEVFFDRYQSLKESVQDEGSVLFQGPSTTIYKYFQAADSFVFMSKLEGMPNVILEAMACGLPTLLNKFKGFSDDYGVEGEHYLSADVHDQESIVRGLQKMSTDEETRAKLSKATQRLIMESFEVSKSIEKYKQL